MQTKQERQSVPSVARGRLEILKISTPDQRWISFEHDTADRIMTAQDHQGRQVTYLYDHGGRLAEVRGLKSTFRYLYNNTYLMKIEENGRPATEFDYEETGRISQLALPDRRTYRFRYEYTSADKDRLLRSVVTAPDGVISKFEMIHFTRRAATQPHR